MTAALLIAAALVAGAAEGVPETDVQAWVSVSPPIFPFHKQTHFTVTVEAPAEAAVEIPELGGQFGALLTTRPGEFAREVLKNGRVRLSKTYTLEAVFAGDYAIQPIPIQVGENESLVIPSPAIRVRELTEEELAAAEHFEPTAGPMGVNQGVFRRWWFWAIVVAFWTALCVVGGLFLLRRHREREAKAPPTPPWQVAYQRLHELDARQLPKQGLFSEYYVDLSGILRWYIEDRFHLHAPEQTTPEFLAEASTSGALTQQHQELLARFLRHCDRVKFARYEPTEDEMDNSLAVVLRFVDETVPVAPGAPPGDPDEGEAA